MWDYAGDGYVHRLIQNKADGKLVELPSAAASLPDARATDPPGGGPTAADALSAEKIEAIGIEYSYLLTSQLDSQRTFYEAQTAELRSQVESMSTLLEQLSTEVATARTRAQAEAAERAAADAARLAERAAKLLLSALRDGSPATHELVDFELVERESVCSL